MSREVKIYSTVGSSGCITTNAKTLGELRPELEARGININNMKLLEGQSKNELSHEEAILPEGDFKIYMIPQKTKSGNISGYGNCGADCTCADANKKLAHLFAEVAKVYETMPECKCNQDADETAEAQRLANKS